VNVSFEVNPEFLRREDIPLSPDVVQYGYERGWLHPATVLDWARREAERDPDNLALVRLASVHHDDLLDLEDALAHVQVAPGAGSAADPLRTWLYLQLKAAFDSRQDLGDPLGVVEQIYADFDYPAALESFIRYMPLRPGDVPGDAAMIERWAAFLQQERDALRRLGTPPEDTRR
jgi:hypothetical protein